MTMTAPRMNAPQTKCYEVLRRVLPPGARILDVSCGKAAIITRLAADGYRVTGTNFSRYDEEPEGIDIRHGVDIRQSLPFEDGSFDGVLLSDVIEHLSDQPKALAELARVAREGGFVVISTPNANRLASRLHFLLTGFVKVKRAFIGFDVTPDQSFAFHNYPLYLPVHLYTAQSLGLELAELAAAGVKPKSVALWLLLGPWAWAATAFTTRVHERNLRGRPAGALLLRTLASFRALCAETAVLVHRKVARPAAAGTTALPTWAAR